MLDQSAAVTHVLKSIATCDQRLPSRSTGLCLIDSPVNSNLIPSCAPSGATTALELRGGSGSPGSSWPNHAARSHASNWSKRRAVTSDAPWSDDIPSGWIVVLAVLWFALTGVTVGLLSSYSAGAVFGVFSLGEIAWAVRK
jgi:hypothetical protein